MTGGPLPFHPAIPPALRKRAAGALQEIEDTIDELDLEDRLAAEADEPPSGAPPWSRAVCMADVAPEAVRWFWKPRIARGKLTLLEGDPSAGKGLIFCSIAAAATRGHGLPYLAPQPPERVLILTTEDGLGDTLRPRLEAAGAALHLVHAFPHGLNLSAEEGIDRLADLVAAVRPGLVILDSFVAYMGAKVDMHRANETRSVLAPLAELAGATGAAFLLVRHLSKQRSGRALHAGLGSVDFTAAVRSQLLAGISAADPNRRALAHTKNNLSVIAPTIGFDIEPVGETARVVWTGDTDLTAGDLLRAEEDGEGRRTIGEAVDFLSEVLSAGPVAAVEIKRQANDAGLAWRTVERAKSALGVEARRSGGIGSAGRWEWRIPA